MIRTGTAGHDFLVVDIFGRASSRTVGLASITLQLELVHSSQDFRHGRTFQLLQIRVAYVLLATVATLLACIDAATATTDKSTASLSLPDHEGPLDLGRHRHLRSRSDITNASEERVLGIENWRYFSNKTLHKILQDEHFRLRMFKKWDQYAFKRFMRRIRMSKMSDSRIAQLIVQYIAKYRTSNLRFRR
ncbi:hypothetical protein PHYSODRAFT_294479 [Phytophthora sojae]|uniref:RxLR effector protein n=1 Tax=Phytophthora sojae (strain P6497) TaxID=1094619 RepID=G4YKT1_PHYSP|nr:hypothetical protein PHYSODRAFT_294479 [Phytophthora sojae]EGZ29235.1 hypothetical protein PHYSODRAFT_294479 [Phytophthora sojae]|eukprot:XP_009516510.1 hypothetical protein PHYSODRAFT_294479 [Phytophthora sojae]